MRGRLEKEVIGWKQEVRLQKNELGKAKKNHTKKRRPIGTLELPSPMRE